MAWGGIGVYVPAGAGGSNDRVVVGVVTVFARIKVVALSCFCGRKDDADAPRAVCARETPTLNVDRQPM